MSSTRSQPALGFLTVQSSDEAGLVGGYLILNAVGRPLEFHCTAPVKPNRAQQILFGSTLESFLYGEQIGQTLVNKGSLEPLAVYTDVAHVLAVRDFIKVPVALVLEADAARSAAEQPAESMGSAPVGSAPAPSAGSAWRVDRAHGRTPLAMFALGHNRLAVAEAHRRDQDEIQQRLAANADFDLTEPFERIREALEEAHKQSR